MLTDDRPNLNLHDLIPLFNPVTDLRNSRVENGNENNLRGGSRNQTREVKKNAGFRFWRLCVKNLVTRSITRTELHARGHKYQEDKSRSDFIKKRRRKLNYRNCD